MPSASLTKLCKNAETDDRETILVRALNEIAFYMLSSTLLLVCSEMVLELSDP